MNATSIFKSNYFQIRLYSVLSVILLLVIGYFTYSNVTKFLSIREEIQSNNEIYETLDDADKRLSTEMQNAQAQNKDLNQKIMNELDLVFPKTESYTTLTRTLDKFSNDLHRIRDPFIINSLTYIEAEAPEGISYMILPFKATIQSSKSNFFKFLEYVEQSGTLQDKSRLIDVESIVINFSSPGGAAGNTSGADEINFNVNMNAYFRGE